MNKTVNDIRQVLNKLREQGKTALMPFITAGDPDLDFSSQVIEGLDQVGCHLLELGFPYSDPVADGPIIQESYVRALRNGVSVEHVFELMAGLKSKIQMPVVAMVSFSIIYRYGIEKFLDRAIETGFAGAIVPDLPLEEIDLLHHAEKIGLALNPLVTPMTGEERAIEIARSASGFIYFVSVVGTTGERTQFAENLRGKIAHLKRALPEIPICIGFGISQVEHVKQLAPLADGLIVGSAFMKRIADCNETGKEATLAEVLAFARALLAAI